MGCKAVYVCGLRWLCGLILVAVAMFWVYVLFVWLVGWFCL